MHPLSSGTMRYNASSITTQNWWSEKVLLDHYEGAVADMDGYMGPTTSVTHILKALAVIFGTVVSFDILMQNFYKVAQGTMRRSPPLP